MEALDIQGRVSRIEKFLRFVYGTIDVERFKKINEMQKELIELSQKDPNFRNNPRFKKIIEETERLRRLG